MSVPTKLGFAIILALCATESGATNPNEAPGASQAARFSERIPVVTLTSSVGDLGAEILRPDTAKLSLEAAQKSAKQAVLYLEIDDLIQRKQDAHSALEMAKALGWVVFAESATWNVSQLHHFISANLPGAELSKLQNVAVRMEWVENDLVITDAWPSEAAAEAGIDFSETSEGLAEGANSIAAKRNERTFLSTYANAAYKANPVPADWETPSDVGYYRLAVNRDVVKVWRPIQSGFLDFCVVSWRGSNSMGDWARNFENQFGRAQTINNQEPHIRAGHGYLARYYNQVTHLDIGSNCDVVHVTGHSLGGGMAQLHTYMLDKYRPARVMFVEMAAYNPARVGNTAFVDEFRRVGNRGTDTVYCRHGDPVPGVPVGLRNVGFGANGCDVLASRYDWINPIGNHWMNLWVTSR